MASEPIGRILAIALRTENHAPMRLIDAASASVDGGLAGDRQVSVERGITLISAAQWRETTTLLNTPELPWHTRRANLLIDAPRLDSWIGKTVRIGEVTLQICGETRPCGLMDEFQPGLRAALKPECRGGVHGRVLEAGTIRVGDAITLLEPR